MNIKFFKLKFSKVSLTRIKQDLKLGIGSGEMVCSVPLPSRKSVLPIHPIMLAFGTLERVGHFCAVEGDEDANSCRSPHYNLK